MKNFLLYTFSTIVGILLTTLFFIIILIAIISVSSSEKPVEIKSGSILYMKLNERIVERAQDSPFNYLPGNFAQAREMGLNDIIENIRKAGEDENIKGIYMELSTINAGYASVEEIRDALIDFKESGKFILAFADIYTQKSYYLSSVADKVYMNPTGDFFFWGMGSEIMFFKDALDKLGIEVQVIKHGEYKSFVEPFISDKMSDENREQIMTWIGSIWDHMLQGIGEERGLDARELNQIAENASIRSANDAVKYKMVDGIKYKDEIINELKELTGTEEKKDLNSVTLRKYTKVQAKRKYRGLAKNKIAVIYAHGDVIMGNGGEGSISSDRISRAIREARRDSTVKAIVLRINSGGGSALASDIIWREADLASQVKPLVASFGDVAASGGYYIAAPADTILAHPSTITGSIGVFALLPNAQGLFNKKLGINIDVAKTNKHADLGSFFRPLSSEEKEIIRHMIEETYTDFIERVSEGRNMSIQEVDEIGRGRVWSGKNASENGLIDAYGGLQDAIEVASSMAGIENYRVISLPKLEDPFEMFVKEITENARIRMIKKELGDSYKYYEEIKSLKDMNGIQARIPYTIDLY